MRHKRVLLRVDFNVPLRDGRVVDDTRIRATLPTLQRLLGNPGASLILMSHLGRPKGMRSAAHSLAPVAERLGLLMDRLDRPPKFVEDCVGPQVEEQARTLRPGEVLMLENLRFHKEEERNDEGFARRLARVADVYVNDAFGSCHRAHASTEAIARLLPAYAGLLIEKEVRFLEPVLRHPDRPLVVIIGGAKVSTKLGVLESLMQGCSAMVIAGGMAYTFLKAVGHAIGDSLVEEEQVETARSLLLRARRTGVELLLPVDHVTAGRFAADEPGEACDSVDIPEGRVGMDIGPATIAKIADLLATAKTVVWNGPMGVFEFDAFAEGTHQIARMVADCDAITIVGGGDSVAAINRFRLADRMSHVSTGGGASLEYLEGKHLPGLAVLMETIA